ncbi:rhodanese-like domain-containing protein [Calidifontibacter sp. DB0510]|uniref:Rhodanese-like domain-containing protein n=1 Tax=Metallococcus carri TaxID=1656884 RepID=A0A967B7H2_9MICO|nr:rhodanese-like domain-containing protein [Metallococcus carri]NHN56156.1 rhodanese-like domain-containing protein [Metallococcus carri]NOP38793.1 rhodanese-like domain-containing protein [Calidifontibacter sp. DB2511S]
MSTIDGILAQARANLDRVDPADLAAAQAKGAFVVDVRPAETRLVEGHIPGAVVIDRLVLEWRLDPTSSARLKDGPDLEQQVVVVCNEGYSSSLAARDLQALGFQRATDLVGGFRAYAAAGLPIAATRAG